MVWRVKYQLQRASIIYQLWESYKSTSLGALLGAILKYHGGLICSHALRYLVLLLLIKELWPGNRNPILTIPVI